MGSSENLSEDSMSQFDVSKLFKSMAKGAMVAKISQRQTQRKTALSPLKTIPSRKNKPLRSQTYSHLKLKESKIDVNIQYTTSDFIDIIPCGLKKSNISPAGLSMGAGNFGSSV